jgi:hypothetical protein
MSRVAKPLTNSLALILDCGGKRSATPLSKRRGGVERQSGVVVQGMVLGLGNADAFEKRCRAALATAVQNDPDEFIGIMPFRHGVRTLLTSALQK